MDLAATLDAPAPPADLFPWVADLARYPAWLTIVPTAVALETRAAEPPAWDITLRGRIGPFARSKRLRMVRTQHEPARLAVFERAETDGRQHSPWVLSAAVEPLGEGSRLTMSLHYGGSLWGPVLEHLLMEEIEQSRPRLVALVSPPTR